MNTKFVFGLANESDDGELRAVIRQISMGGSISIAFCREPSFFLAEKTGCIKNNTLVCRESDTGKIIGVGSRSLRRVYINGTEKILWYLSMLRLLPEARNSMTLIRGYKYLRSLSSDSDESYSLQLFLTIMFVPRRF